MCLYIKNSENYKLSEIDKFIKIANKNIIVYKRLKKSDDFNSDLTIKYNYYTPYMNMYISNDGDILTTKKFSFSKTLSHFSISVNEGIHSYLKKTKANYFSWSNEIIVKCIIPKGTPYILGINDEIVSLILIIPPIE